MPEKKEMVRRLTQREYTPAIVSHPSETIYDFLMEDPQKYFKKLATLPRIFSHDIIEYMAAAGTDDDVKMTDELAENLHAVFGASKEFWFARDKQYEEWKAKQK